MADYDALSYHPLQQHALLRTFPNNTDLDGVMTMFFTISWLGFVPVKQHRLVCMPTTYEKQTETRANLQYTKGGIYVDRPDNGIGAVHFTIAGTSGFRAVTGISGENFIDGAAGIKDFEETILSYMDPGAVSLQIAAPTMFIPKDQLKLIFMDTSVPVSAEDPGGLCEYEVIPDRGGVSISRNARKPHMWDYRFSFTGTELLLSFGGNQLGISRMAASSTGGLSEDAKKAAIAIAGLMPSI